MKNFSTPSTSDPWVRVGVYSGAGSAAEIGLGSALHAWNLPFAGHFLANLQGVTLAAFLGGKYERRKYVFFVAAISGALKSLSPAGKRLKPMLGIFTQGLLYHAAVGIFGAGFIGIVLGQALIGFWCSIQPFFLQYVFFGADILKSYESLFSLLERVLPFNLGSPFSVLGWWLGLNAAASAGIGILAFKGFFGIPVENISDSESQKTALPMRSLPSWSHCARSSLKELRRPYFLWPFLFVAAISLLGHKNMEEVAFTLIRAVLIAFTGALLLKRLDIARIMKALNAKGFSGPASALDIAVAELPRSLKSWKH